MTTSDIASPSAQQVLAWLDEVPDPEVPVISIVDLGIVRGVRHTPGGPDEWVVTVTPTYSGCPATHVIAKSIVDALRHRGLGAVRVETQISPPWTTDWMSESGKERLHAYGIAPPKGAAMEQRISIADIKLGRRPIAEVPHVVCPQCGSTSVSLSSQFGSTPCKALYRCLSCREPFDYFKCH